MQVKKISDNEIYLLIKYIKKRSLEISEMPVMYRRPTVPKGYEKVYIGLSHICGNCITTHGSKNIKYQKNVTFFLNTLYMIAPSRRAN